MREKENIILHNGLKQKEAELSLDSSIEANLRCLSRFCGQVNAFGTNSNDEFVVQRENGKQQGIFKAWAVPVVPFLDMDRLDILDELWNHIRLKAQQDKPFEETLQEIKSSPNSNIADAANTAERILQDWHDVSISQPERLKESLERSRVTSWAMDRRLTSLFCQEELSEDTTKRIGQLTDRLSLSLGLLSPFYNIEALIADPSGFRWNPIKNAEEKLSEGSAITGGRLDLIAQLLPSVLREFIDSERLNWNGLSWERIRQRTKEILNQPGESRKMLLEAAKLAQSNPEHIVFAMNVLEWIPLPVGGKKRDLHKEAAIRQLADSKNKHLSDKNARIVKTGKDMNALIRFLNWLPLIEGEENINLGINWTYASVCDTTNLLLETLSAHPEVWEDDFSEVFQSKLLPQLQNLDATSAKGRFLLHLILEEKRLKPEFSQFINDQKTKDRIIAHLLTLRSREWIRDLAAEVLPRYLIGGKAFGLAELINNLPIEVDVPNGIILTTEAVEDILRSNQDLFNIIIEFNNQSDFQKQTSKAQKIREAIASLDLPIPMGDKILNKLEGLGVNESFAVRSSSSDEDIEEEKGAAGIYESILDVNIAEIKNAIKKCIASFFSEKAIQFRNMNGQGHIPNFAILIQPFIKGKGGTAFSKNLHGNEDACIVDVANNPSMVSSGSNEFSEFIITRDGQMNLVKGEMIIDWQTISKVTKIVTSIREITGREVDMEWVQDESGRIWILQARTLNSKELEEAIEKKVDWSVVLKPQEDIEFLNSKLSDKDGLFSLTLIGRRNLDAFQGELFAAIAKFGNKIVEILHEEDIPLTSHFANICASLGIRLKKMEAKNA